VKAVEFFLLPLPAPHKVSRFWVCFCFQFLSSKCFRFHKNLTASTSLGESVLERRSGKDLTPERRSCKSFEKYSVLNCKFCYIFKASKIIVLMVALGSMAQRKHLWKGLACQFSLK